MRFVPSTPCGQQVQCIESELLNRSRSQCPMSQMRRVKSTAKQADAFGL